MGAIWGITEKKMQTTIMGYMKENMAAPGC